jgi:hypothetical protein
MALSPAQKTPTPPSNDPLQSLAPEEAVRIVRRRGRLRALLVLAIAVLVSGLEWYDITHEHKFSPKGVIVGICCLALGIPGLIEPRIILAMGRADDRALVKERHFRIIGWAILVPAVIGAIAFCEWLQR